MTKFLKTNYNQTIAYNKIDGEQLGIVFLSGLKSDMTGQKAVALEEWAVENNHSFLRFDYSGHGISSGKFESFVISDWILDAKTIITKLTKGPQILVGSSMGGWIMLALAKKKLVNVPLFLSQKFHSHLKLLDVLNKFSVMTWLYGTHNYLNLSAQRLGET